MSPSQQLSAAFVKCATPRWARELAAGGIGDLKKLVSSVPQGLTRRVGTEPLGQGVEGVVHKGFTGGKGYSAIKTFFDKPNLNPSRRGIISSKGISSLYTGGTPHDRADVMRQFPSLFPDIYGTHARGYVSELLTPVGAEFSSTFGRQKLQKFVNRVRDNSAVLSELPQDNRSKWRALLDVVFNPKKHQEEKVNSIRRDIASRRLVAHRKALGQSFSNRGSVQTQESELMRKLEGLREKGTVTHEPVLKLPDNRFFKIKDFRVADGFAHNYMFSPAKGHAVISDFLATPLKPRFVYKADSPF